MVPTAGMPNADGAQEIPGRAVPPTAGRTAEVPSQSCWASSQRSASMAAMHPEPAAVTAWR